MSVEMSLPATGHAAPPRSEFTPRRILPTNGREFRRQPRGPKDLLGFLMAHGARARRAARPRCEISLKVLSPTGAPAIRIQFD